jgi:uncharacterized protein YbjT (DUF2867 family)
MKKSLSVIILGATGAVGEQAARAVADFSQLKRLSLLGRREVEGLTQDAVSQHVVDIFNPDTYRELLTDHETAICTLGVGEPSKISKEDFVKIDRDAVLNFASACKDSGVKHFELLSAVGVNSKSSSFYLRTKGELEDGLKALNFERLSLFHPSMIMTPAKRYGIATELLLSAMPFINPLLLGPLQKFRGIAVERLGVSMAKNILLEQKGVETLVWNDFLSLS